MKILRADSHADTIEVSMNRNLNLKDRDLSFNIEDIKDNLPYIQCMACFIHDKYINRGYEKANELLDYYYTEEKNNEYEIKNIKSSKDIDYVILKNKLGTLLTIENGIALDNDIDNLYRLYKKGIRMMTITWNGDNQLGCGALTKQDNGLTSFGRKCINVMNNIDMIIDVSHASVKTFWDVLDLTRKPVIASHSNVYNICKHRRNLSDFQIKEIAKANGVIGINYCSNFLTEKKKSIIQDVVNHIAYVCNLIGPEYVCLGSDFDGTENLPANLKGVKDLYKIEECMLVNGFTEENIRNIMGENLIGFLKNNLE